MIYNENLIFEIRMFVLLKYILFLPPLYKLFVPLECILFILRKYKLFVLRFLKYLFDFIILNCYFNN